MPLTESVISDGQSAAVPGTSDDSSMANSRPLSLRLPSLALLGNWYSRKPRVNQIKPCMHAVGVKKGIGHIQQADDALRAAQAARACDFATGIKPKRHGHFDGVGTQLLRVFLEHHQHLVKSGMADFLVALLGTLGFRADQPGVFQHLNVGGHRGLRQSQCGCNVVDVHAALEVQ